MIMLDSDVMIDLLRQYSPAIMWLTELGEAEILLSGFVAMELLQGCQNKAEQDKLETILSGFNVIWPSVETCEAALQVFADYHLSHNIGVLDALIGQTAVDLGLPLHTFNRKHYAVIPHLLTQAPYVRH